MTHIFDEENCDSLKFLENKKINELDYPYIQTTARENLSDIYI